VIFIRNGKATKEIKSRLTGKTLKRYNDGVRITERDIVPYALATSQAGELFVRTFDISKARNEAMSLASRDRLGPYKADFQTFYGDLARYLNNLSDRENAVPTKELFGDAAKAAYMTDFFGGKDGTAAKYIRNFTLDRMIDMRPTGEKVSMSQIAYDRNKARFMPAENLGESKVFDSPDTGFRIISKNNKHSLYAPTGERLGIYDTQAKAESVSSKIQNKSTQISVSQPKVADGIVTAPESGAFKFTKDVAANFMPADSKVRLDDYADRTIIALAADRMGVGQAEVGPFSNRRILSVPTQGGRGFMKIFNGGGWAFSDTATANRFLSRLTQVADKKGNALVGITVLNPINHLNNQTGQLAYIEAMRAAVDGGVVTKSQADAHIKAISDRILSSKAKSLNQTTRDIFSNTTDLKSLENAIKDKALNFNSAAWLVKKAQGKTLPISYKEQVAHGISVEQIAKGLTDKELIDIPDYSVVALMEVNVNQKPDANNFHYAYPISVHGKTVGFLDKFYNLADLSTNPKIRTKKGRVTAQPVQTVMPILDNIRKTLKTQQGIPSDPAQRVNFMPDTPESKFYSSRIISAVENSSQGKANGSQWKATIKNSKLGVNQDEYALVGVGDLEDGKTYTKAEVLDYLRANEVVVKDVTLGGENSGAKVVPIRYDSIQTEVTPKNQSSDEPITVVAHAYSDGTIDLGSVTQYPEGQYQRGFEFVAEDMDGRAEGFHDLESAGEWLGRKIEQPVDPTHFSQYTLPGAKEGSYREVLLTVPDVATGRKAEAAMAVKNAEAEVASGKRHLEQMRREQPNNVKGIAASESYLAKNEEKLRQAKEVEANEPADARQSWRDGHDQYSDISNPIVRLRTNERTTADGKRMLFIEEVQAPQRKEFEKMPALFQKNWREIAFKWALRTAADNGFDLVGYTTGKQQAERYDLSKQLSEISYSGSNLKAYDKNGNVTVSKTGVKPEELPDIIGKEAAKKLMEQEPKGTLRTISGLDLNVGGEGLKKLYDQDFRNVVNNLPVVKKSGQKVGMAEIVTQDKKMVESPINVGEPTFEQSQLTTRVYSINVAPEMRNASVSFMPSVKFSAPEKLPNGQAWSTDNNYRVIQKEGGKYRVYAPTGTLIGVADTLDKSKKLIEKRSR
jgi:hypothetical protein